MWKQLTCITNKYHRKQEWHGGDKEHCFHLDALRQNDCQSDFKHKTIETFPNFMHTHRERRMGEAKYTTGQDDFIL